MGRKNRHKHHKEIFLDGTVPHYTFENEEQATLAAVEQANKELVEKKRKKARKFNNNKDLPYILERDVCSGFAEHAERTLSKNFDQRGMCYCCVFYDIDNDGGCVYHHVEKNEAEFPYDIRRGISIVVPFLLGMLIAYAWSIM